MWFQECGRCFGLTQWCYMKLRSCLLLAAEHSYSELHGEIRKSRKVNLNKEYFKIVVCDKNVIFIIVK